MAKREGFSGAPDRRPARVAFCAGIFFCLFAHFAGAVPYDTNILTNGNAEAGPASTIGAPVTVPGWTTTSECTVVPYGSLPGVPSASQGPPDGLKQFFAGGVAEATQAIQDIDVSANAVDIDSGSIVCDLSAWLGGFANQTDLAYLTIVFQNAAATGLSSATIGPVTAADRNNQTKLLLRQLTSIAVPAQTRGIRAILNLERGSGGGTFNDGYADSLNITLRVVPKLGANLLHDGGFESSPGPGFSSSWALNEPNGFSNVGTNPVFAHSGTKHANLAPNVGTTGSLSQMFATIPGTRYTLSFWRAYFLADSNTFLSAYIDNNLVFATVTLPSAGDGIYQPFATTFTAQSTTTTLRLDYRNDPDFWSLDDVSVVPAPTLANVSTRLRVETGDNALIGGFIVTGTAPKKVMLRAIGPSLSLPGQLANPTLELYSGPTLLASNDDWQNQPAGDRQAVIDSTIPPANNLEAALVRTLPANGASYTAIVRGANNGIGIGIVEAYDLDRSVNSKLANISTRGLVQTGDNILIAGTIVLGASTQKVIVRAIGPSLSVAGKLPDPNLELRDQNGSLIEANDNWMDSPDKQAIIGSTIPPTNDLESAIVRTLAPAAYTAIVRGANNTTGVAVVEVYALN